MGLGFQGFAKLGTDFLLANTTGLDVQINPILSTAVFGSGWFNAAQTTNFADNQLTYEGPIDFDFQASGSILDFVRDWAVTERAFSKDLSLSPDGSVVYDYLFTALSEFDGAWNSALSLTFDPEALVSASATAIAIKRSETFADLQYFDNKFGVGTPVNPLNPSPRNTNPVPGWNAEAAFVTDGARWEDLPAFGYDSDFRIEMLNFNLDITNNTVIVRTCNGKRVPSAVLQGTINTTGSATLYREGGIKDPVKLLADGVTEAADYVFAEDTFFGVAIASTLFIKVPFALITTSDYGVQGQNELSSRTFGFQGLGDGVLPPIEFPGVNPLP